MLPSLSISQPHGRRSQGDGHAPAWSGALDAAREVAAGAAERAPEADRPGGFPAADVQALREAGLLVAPLRPADGGVGLGSERGSLHALLTVLRTVGRGSLPLGRLYEGHVNALLLIDQYATDAQRQRWAADAQEGHLFGVWNTEVPSDGVRYARDGDAVRVEGAKTFATGCAHVTRPLVPGALGDGWQMAVLPTDQFETVDQPETWRAEGMRASMSGRVDFSGAVLGADVLVGAPGDYLREPEFTGGSVRFAAVQLGGADALAHAMAEHLRQLNRTDHPTQRIRAGEVATLVETGALWLLGASRLLDPPAGTPDPAAVRAYAQMARTAIEHVCLGVMERADRAVGARGLGQPGVLERVGRDLRLYLRQPNPDGAVEAAGAYAFDHPGGAVGSAL